MQQQCEGEACEPSGVPGCNFGVERPAGALPEPQSCWGAGVMGIHSVKFKDVGRGQREKGNLSHMFLKLKSLNQKVQL